MSVAMRETSAGLALDKEGFPILQGPGDFKRREKRRRLEPEEEIKERVEKMRRLT